MPATAPRRSRRCVSAGVCGLGVGCSFLEPVTKPAAQLLGFGRVACSLEFCDRLLVVLQIAAGLSSIFLGGSFFVEGGTASWDFGRPLRLAWGDGVMGRGQGKSIPGSVASGRRLGRWAQRLGVDYANFMSHGVLPAAHPDAGRSAAFWSGWKA